MTQVLRTRMAAMPKRFTRVLEEQIIPLYYKTSESGIPQDWVKAMKAAMISNAARFSARRMVKEYIDKFYCQEYSKDTE